MPHIDPSLGGKVIDILPSYYTKDQQSNINNSLFLREYRSQNLSYVVERFSQPLASVKALKRYNYIVVDCASAFDDIGLAAAILSPFVVVASEADDISFEAMDETLGYTISFAMSNTQNGDYNIKQPFIALNKDQHLRPGEKTSRRAAFHCKYIPDIYKSFGKKSFLVPAVIEGSSSNTSSTTSGSGSDRGPEPPGGAHGDQKKTEPADSAPVG